MTTNTDPVRALLAEWRGTHGGGFTSQGEFQAHLSTLRTCADELETALSQQPAAPNIRKDTAVRNRDNADPAKVDTGCRHNFVRDEDNGGECCQKCGKVRIRQPAAPSGEAVAWAAMSAAGSRVVSISLERDEYVGHVVPLYTAPQQPAGVDEAAAVLADLHPFLFGLKLAAPNEEKRAFIQERIDAVRRASAALAAQQQGGTP